jgi:hypothetical protein
MKWLLCLLLISFLSCSDESTSPDSPEIECLVPLNIGNFWDYEFENNGVRRDSVKSKEVIEEQDIYFLETDMGSWTALKAIYNSFNGYDETLYFNVDLNNSTYHFKYPVKVGDTWKNTFVFDHGWTNNYKCLHKNAKVDVPGGSFSCILYEVETKTNVANYLHHYYFKPGIGLIAIKKLVSDSSGQKEEWEKRLSLYYLVE